MKKILFIVLIFVTFIRNSFGDVYFSQECKTKIIDLIKNSQKEILIAVYSIDDPDISQELSNFIDRGGDIKIITDRVQAAGRQSKSPELYNKIKDKFRINSSRFRIMHDKFAIFDSKTSVNGSFNWTFSAANRNAEDCKISHKQEEVDAFYNRFYDMWDSFSSQETDYFFKKLSLKRKIKENLAQNDIENKNSTQNSNLKNSRVVNKKNKFFKKKFKKCFILCKKGCINNAIIKYNIQQAEQNLRDTESNESAAVNVKKNIISKKTINFCRIKCKKRCLMKIKTQQELMKQLKNNKFKKKFNNTPNNSSNNSPK